MKSGCMTDGSKVVALRIPLHRSCVVLLDSLLVQLKQWIYYGEYWCSSIGQRTVPVFGSVNWETDTWLALQSAMLYLISSIVSKTENCLCTLRVHSSLSLDNVVNLALALWTPGRRQCQEICSPQPGFLGTSASEPTLILILTTPTTSRAQCRQHVCPRSKRGKLLVSRYVLRQSWSVQMSSSSVTPGTQSASAPQERKCAKGSSGSLV